MKPIKSGKFKYNVFNTKYSHNYRKGMIISKTKCGYWRKLKKKFKAQIENILLLDLISFCESVFISKYLVVRSKDSNSVKMSI